MSTFVLVHPAWFGGWSWKKVVQRVQSAGHTVHAPTLTGLGERAHLAHPGVSLTRHIEDIVNVLVFEDLDAVTLVANSSGGTVLTGVAAQAPERIERVVYLFVRDAWQVTDEEDLRWVLSRLRPTPVGHFTEPIHLGDAHDGERPRRVYIRCRGNNPAPHFDQCAATAQSSPEWTYHELMLPHLPYLTHPDETTQMLLGVVA